MKNIFACGKNNKNNGTLHYFSGAVFADENK
jgi:hypothetical protein